MATHSSTLAWKIPWMEERGRLTVHGVAKSRTRLSQPLHFIPDFRAGSLTVLSHPEPHFTEVDLSPGKVK